MLLASLLRLPCLSSCRRSLSSPRNVALLVRAATATLLCNANSQSLITVCIMLVCCVVEWHPARRLVRLQPAFSFVSLCAPPLVARSSVGAHSVRVRALAYALSSVLVLTL